MIGFARSVLSAVLLFGVAGCDGLFDGSECECSLKLEYYTITVLDQQGDPVPDVDLTVTVPRTADTLDLRELDPYLAPEAGRYPVFGDTYIHQINPLGEDVRVSGVSGGRGFAVDFVFDVPGRCRCHVNKVSGPDTVLLP
jgi:hypothetical protein